MENYKLKENEVVLYKGDIKLAKNNEEARLILTNLNLVFVPNSNEVATEVYPVEEIKVYENQPQVKTRGNIVEIYLTSTEKEFSFVHKLDSLKFMNAIKKLLTGKTAMTRIKAGALAIKNALTSDTAKSVANKVGVVANKLGAGVCEVGGMAKRIGETAIESVCVAGNVAKNLSEAVVNVSIASKNVTENFAETTGNVAKITQNLTDTISACEKTRVDSSTNLVLSLVDKVKDKK